MKGAALVVEDHAPAAARTARLLAEAFPALHTALAADLQQARACLATGEWGLALVDLGLPDGSGLTLIHELRQRPRPVPTVVLSVHDDDNNLFAALRAGAEGYLLKEQPDAQLMHQLRLWAQGQPPLSPRMAQRLLAHFRPPPAGPEAAVLTARECEVLACIGRGLRVHEVAMQLGIAESTVTSYVKSIYNKLNINSRAEAAREAMRRGLV